MRKAFIIILSITLLLTIFLMVVFQRNLHKGKEVIYGNISVTEIPYVSIDLDYIVKYSSRFTSNQYYKNGLVSYHIDYIIDNYEYEIITEYDNYLETGDISINAHMNVYWHENPNDDVITNDGFEYVVTDMSCVLNLSRYIDTENIINEDILGIDVYIDGYNSILTLDAYLKVLSIEFPKINFNDNDSTIDYLKDILSVLYYPNSLVYYVFNVDNMIEIIYGYKLLEVN